MNFWKPFGCFGLSAAMLFGLAGCKPPEEAPSPTGETQAAETQPPETHPDFSGCDWDHPGHYEKELSEKLSVDAVICGPKDGKTPAVYEARKFQTGAKDLGPFLEALDDSIESVTYEEENPGKGPEYYEYNYLGETQKGAAISTGWHDLTPNAIPYDKGDHFFLYQHYPEQKAYDLFINGGMDGRTEDLYRTQKRDTTVLFQEPKQFSFGSAEEYAEEVVHLLGLVGIQDLELLNTYYLDHEAMENALENPDYAIDTEVLFPDGVEYTPDMDAYAYLFTQVKDGIPVLLHDFERVTVAYSAPELKAICNQNGVLCMHCLGFYNFGEVAEVPDSILSVEEALDRALTVIQKSDPPYTRIIDHVSIQYYLYQDQDQWVYRPCWVVSVLNADKTYLGQPAPDHTMILLDAITGEEF